ncbi:MAG: endonuclease [Leeuwenhoekiella sp.]
MRKIISLILLLLLIGCSGDDNQITSNPEQEVNKPVAQADTYTTVENQKLSISNLLENDTIFDFGRVSDVDPQSSEGGSVIDNRDGTFTYTPPSDFIGEDTFSYTLCDAKLPANCSSALVTITVAAPVAPDPVAVDDEYVYTQQNEPITIDGFTDNDLVYDASVTEINYTGSGSASLNDDGTITYSSQVDFIGEDIITYTLCNDVEGATCVTGTITITLVQAADTVSLTIPDDLKSYYGDITFTTDKDANYTVLSNLTQVKHTTILSYGQRHDYLYEADADLSNSANVILLYSGESRDKREYLSGNNSYSPQTFNTEHIYPQSLFNDQNVKGDLYHLRSADVDINADRGNYPFADATGSYQLVNGNSWYPGDEWKGDVARALLYLNITYGEDLSIVGSLDLFLKWNVEDPVSAFEMQRNTVIEGAQGNRNPFIDNAYLATLIWGGEPAANSWE